MPTDRDGEGFVSQVGSIFRTGRAPRPRSGGGDLAARLSEIEAGLGGGEDGGTKKKTAPPLPNWPRGYSPSQAGRISDYRGGPTSQGMGPPVGGVARYYDGEQDLPANMPPHNIAALQRLMVEAGLLSSPRWGFWDEDSKDAYQTALSEANRAGTDIETLLSTYAEAAAIGTQEAVAPFVPGAMEIQVPNKKDVEKVLRDSIVEKLGQGWSQKQISDLADQYMWKVMEPQADAYRQETARAEQEYNYEAGLGPAPTQKQITRVDVMAPETFAEDEARRRDPGGFQATQVAEDFAPAFFAALGPGGAYGRG